MRKKPFQLLLCVLILFGFLSVLPISVSQEEPSNGNITFEPNVIPFLNITFVEEFFRFKWTVNDRDNKFDLKLLIVYNDTKKGMQELSLKDFWEKTDRVMNWENMSNRATESMYEFGYNITDIPQEIADNVEYLVWKIEGASFDVSEIRVEVLTDLPELTYNITRFHLPDGIVLSYEDLWLYNFTVSHPNKLETKVEGVKGKSSWNLDPITYSSPIITVIGGTAGSPLGFLDIWNEDQTQSWNVVDNNNNSSIQFEFSARIVLGNGTSAGTTYFNDTAKQILFNETPFTANWQIGIDVTRYTYVTFGTLVDEATKTTREGIDFILNKTAYRPMYLLSTISNYNTQNRQLYVYSSAYQNIGSDSNRIFARAQHGNIRFWNIQIKSGKGFYIKPIGSPTINIYNIMVQDAEGQGSFEVYGSTGLTIDEASVASALNIVWTQTTATFTVRNVYGRQNTRVLHGSTNWAGPGYFIDWDIDNWVFLWHAGATGKLYRQYSFDLNITDSAGTPIQNANATIKHYGQAETQDFSILTGSNGSFATQTLTMGFYNQTGANTIYDYNPYNITITHDSYTTKTFNFTLEDKTEWVITLETPTTPTVSTTTYMLQGALLFSPIMLAIALSRRNKAKR